MKDTIQKSLGLFLILLGISGNLLSQDEILKTSTNITDQPVVINGVAVPGDFPFFSPTINEETAPGHIFINNWNGSPYIMIFRNDGTPYYYKKVEERSRDFKVQPGGLLSRRVRNPAWGYIVMDSNYRDIDTLRCQNGYDTDEHELQLLPNGNALMIALENRKMDLSQLTPGGHPDATVIGNHVQELDPDHNVVFEWLCWDYFDILGTYEDLSRAQLDYIHMNSIAVDYDGNIVVSSRHLSECTKIDRQTGDIIWRLGGKNNQFTFINDDDQISYQHDIRPVPGKPNHYTIFDNGDMKNPPYSRAVEFVLDTVAMTAEKVWEYRHTPDWYTHWMGNAQPLPNGNIFINWADTPLPKAFEVTPDGEVVYEADFNFDTPTYRSFRFEWDGMKLEPYLITEQYTDKIRLIFNKFGDEGVDYYRIYSGTSQEQLELTDSTENTWMDIEMEESGTYYFQVTAIDTSGAESLPSNMEYGYFKKTNYGDNLILNGDFSQEDEHWILLNHEGASSTGSVTDDGYEINIGIAGTLEWHIQLIQENIPLIHDAEYLFEFEARADASRVVDIKLQKNGTPWTNYSHTGTVFLTKDTKSFAYSFIMHDPTDPGARFALDAGLSDIDFSINNVSVRLMDPATRVNEKNTGPAEMKCYPNPSSNSMLISFYLGHPSEVKLYIYNLTGQLVEIIDQGYKEAGHHEIHYPAASLSNGSYLIRLEAGTQIMHNKIVIAR